MENFNVQFCKHSQLELLKHIFLEHGTYMKIKKGEQFSFQGKVNHRGAYIEEGLFRYTRVDEKGNIHVVGYTFSRRIYRQSMHTHQHRQTFIGNHRSCLRFKNLHYTSF